MGNGARGFGDTRWAWAVPEERERPGGWSFLEVCLPPRLVGPSSAALPQASPAWPVRMSPPPRRSSLCRETHALLPQLAASAQSEQFQELLTGLLKKLVFKDHFLYYLHLRCDREPLCWGKPQSEILVPGDENPTFGI